MLSVGLIDKRVSVAIDEQKHGCIYGQTGYGKSMLLYLLLTTMLFRNRAFFLIDGAGDLVSDLCAWLRKQTMDAQDIVVIKVSPQCLFHFDPFDAEGRTGKEYRAWLDAKVKRVAREFIRSSGQFNFNETKRMERWLKNAIYACGVDYEPGRHLGLDRMLDILNVGSAEWETLFLQVAPHVPCDVASDLWELRKDSPHIRDKKIESTVNRLRSFLTPLVKEILRTSDAPSLRSAIRQGKTVLCDLAANGDFDHEDSVTLGGLLISEVMEAKETERDHRRQLTLFIDEAESYIGEDISRGLTVGRHWGLNFWFSFQTLSSMKNEMIDMTRKIVSQCGTHIAFRMPDPFDAEFLAKLYGYPSMKFDQHKQPIELHGGYDWHLVPEHGQTSTVTNGETMTVSESLTDTRSLSTTEGTSEESATGTTETNGTNDAKTDGQSNGVKYGESVQSSSGMTTSESNGSKVDYSVGVHEESGTGRHSGHSRAESESSGGGTAKGKTLEGFDWRAGRESTNQSENMFRSESNSNSESEGTSENRSSGKNRSRTSGKTFSLSSGRNMGIRFGRDFGKSRTLSSSRTHGTSSSLAKSESLSSGRNLSKTAGRSFGITNGRSLGRTRSVANGKSVTYRHIPLARKKRLMWATGKLQVQTADQLAYVGHRLASLGKGEAVIMCGGNAYVMRVFRIKQLGCPRYVRCIAQRFIESSQKKHAYFFVPTLEEKQWTIENATKNSKKSSPSTHARSGSSSKSVSSPATRWRGAGSKNSGNGNGHGSSGPSNSTKEGH